jgi:hypothetical protein
MRSKIVLGLLAFAVALVFVVPAGAINIGGTEYLLFGRCKIGMENGPIFIDGNVAVNEICGLQNGFLHIGVDNVITGSGTANRIFFGTDASVGVCNFNQNAGGNANNVCGAQNAAVLPITAWPPLPIPTVTPGATDVTCTGNLAAGSYRNIQVPNNATCTLQGNVDARAVIVGTGGTLNGGFNLNLTSTFNTEPGAIINNVNITSVLGVLSGNTCIGANGLGSTAEAIETGNNTVVTGSVFYAPCARMHLHQGGDFSSGFEGIAVLITVEPVRITDGLDIFCTCPPGTHFALDAAACAVAQTCLDARRCVPN